ncbi:FecR family protein [Dyadobacter sp. NIV53]|uniref:FecR family protein n=1 Tax=Dyadobacter sp. NIV53 TaxID=2861765 RepID=UPI001C88D4F5|nr:FecR family protein [Dyadobacter sp. NIV53]
MQDDRIHYLAGKFFDGTSNEPEVQELAAWIKQNPDDELALVLENAWQNFQSDTKMPEDMSDRIIGTIFPEKNIPLAQNYQEYESETSTVNLWPKIAAAAILIMAIGLYWWSGSGGKARIAQTKPEILVTDVMPGGNKAVLTLGDGSSIILDSAKNGNLASQGNTSITKSGTGELVYKASGEASNTIVFNTVATPKGGQYHIVLPDGSRVWLNAASSLKFPTSFTGKDRRVEITGEVYFEVAHNARMPFIVKAYETEVEVLGTHFNMNAYPDEKRMKTTLLEGAVKVSKGNQSAVLSPGQQADILNMNNNIRVLNNVDTDKEMAWKNGYFQFEDENLESIMRQVSRWYDVEVNYEGNPGKEHFTGRLPRNANVSKVFKILSLSGIKFRIEGKTIIVTP